MTRTPRRRPRELPPALRYQKPDAGEQIPPQITYDAFLAGGQVEIVSFGAAQRILFAQSQLATEVGSAYAPYKPRSEYGTMQARLKLHHDQIRHFNYIRSLLHALYSRVATLEAELLAARGQ